MNNKIKYLISGILIISGVIALSALRNPNDYYAFMGGFVDITTSAVDDNALNVTFVTYYIPLTTSATYTLTVIPVTTSINMSQPGQINMKIKDSILSQAVQRGYNLKKIIMQTYSVNNP